MSGAVTSYKQASHAAWSTVRLPSQHTQLESRVRVLNELGKTIRLVYWCILLLPLCNRVNSIFRLENWSPSKIENHEAVDHLARLAKALLTSDLGREEQFCHLSICYFQKLLNSDLVKKSEHFPVLRMVLPPEGSADTPSCSERAIRRNCPG